MAVQRIHAPSLDRGFQWLNTDRPLDFGRELRGQVVLLDFWTYCCINCMHVLPDLTYLESKYADQPFVVIGVHSNKFTNESVRRNVRAAVLRYEIAHPVVIDEQMEIWRSFGVNSWPTRILVDPEGYAVGGAPGEGHLDVFDDLIEGLLAEHREKGTLAPDPLQLRREIHVPSTSGLRFPGKVLADHELGRLFIADSNHNRIVVTSWPDDAGNCTLIATVGTGEPGLEDGPPDRATFNHPQGLARDGDRLYVADTENHVLRLVSLNDWSVVTVAGTGRIGNDRRGGAKGTAQSLNSPWDVAVRGGRVAIAMAGTHQLWVYDPASGVTQVLAGSGREDIVDGAAFGAALAQPSGLALTDDVLYFADSETSAIRGLDLRTRVVFTVIGEGLFEFGDIDGGYPAARLQHCLGLAAWRDALLVADTYNHKLKLVDPQAQQVHSLAGFGAPATRNERGDLGLFEPGGVSVAGDTAFVADTNNHRVVRMDLPTGRWDTLHVTGLEAPLLTELGEAICAEPVTIDPGATVRLVLRPRVPEGAHLNRDAPVSIKVVDADGRALLNEMLMGATLPIEVAVPEARGVGSWEIDLHFGYCTEGDQTLCVPHSVRWSVPVEERAADAVDTVELHE